MYNYKYNFDIRLASDDDPKQCKILIKYMSYHF